MIRYLKEKEIDPIKWDSCISTASCTLPYAYNYYLKIVCKNRGALILNDYEAVMPLPFAYKYGIPYIYQPFFTQQLGIFSASTIDATLIKKFITAIPKKFSYISTQFNYKCVNNSNLKSFSARKNYILKLSKPYSEIFANFSENTKRNIKQSEKNNLQIKINTLSPNECRKFYQEHNPIDKSKKTDELLENIITETLKYNKGETWSVHNANNTLLAFAHFIKEKNRIVFIAPASSTEGKKQKAMFYLINVFCEKFANTDMVLDFEGSEIINVARFYLGFNAEIEFYPIYTKNILFVFNNWRTKK